MLECQPCELFLEFAVFLVEGGLARQPTYLAIHQIIIAYLSGVYIISFGRARSVDGTS